MASSLCEIHTRTIQHAQLPSADCECRRRSNTSLTLMLFLLFPHCSHSFATLSSRPCMGESALSRTQRSHVSALSSPHSTRIISTFGVKCVCESRSLCRSLALLLIPVSSISFGHVERCIYNHFPTSHLAKMSEAWTPIQCQTTAYTAAGIDSRRRKESKRARRERQCVAFVLDHSVLVRLYGNVPTSLLFVQPTE